MVSKDSWIHFRPLVKCPDCSRQSWWLGNPPNVQRSGQIELKTCVHFTKTPSRLVGICFVFLWNSFDDVWIRFVTKTFQTSLLVILISTRDTHNLSYAYVLMLQGTKEGIGTKLCEWSALVVNLRESKQIYIFLESYQIYIFWKGAVLKWTLRGLER